jgi:hypothetical protein
MKLRRGYDLEMFVGLANSGWVTGCTTFHVKIQLWLYVFASSKYNQKYDFRRIDFLSIFWYYILLLKSGRQMRSETLQARQGGIGNEKDISDISNVNSLIHFFVSKPN